MSRVIAFCFLLLATVLAYLHIDSLPAWAPFASDYPVNIANQADDSPETTEGNKPVKPLKNTASVKMTQPNLQMDWLPDTGRLQYMPRH